MYRVYKDETFVANSCVSVFIFVWNVVLSCVYFMLSASALYSLNELILVINRMAKQSASARITNVAEMDDWNDDFLNFQNTLQHISRNIQFPVSWIYAVAVLSTVASLLLTWVVGSIAFPEWFQLVMLTLLLLAFSLYFFYLISDTSLNLEEAVCVLQTTQMFIARKHRKQQRIATGNTLLQSTDPTSSSSGSSSAQKLTDRTDRSDQRESLDQLHLHLHLPPVVSALDYIIKYWDSRQKELGLSLFGIRIDRKLVYTVLGMIGTVSLTVLNKLFSRLSFA